MNIRAYRAPDYELCRAIFLANESRGIPICHLEKFSKTLLEGKARYLIAEKDGNIVGFGALTGHPAPYHRSVSLSFGMVDPRYQRKGIGTALLLARLAILPKPNDVYTLSITALPRAQSFFRQFGFGFVASFEDKVFGMEFDTFAVQMYFRQWKQARERLRESGISFEIDETIPVVPVEQSDDRAWKVAPIYLQPKKRRS